MITLWTISQKFGDATKEILEAVSGDSNTDYDEKMEPVAAIPAHLADNFHSFNDIHGSPPSGDLCLHILLLAIFPNSLKFAKIGTRLKR